MHVCTGARGAEIPCHSTLQRWTGLFGRCCRLSRPWCAQEQIIDEVCSRNGRLPKVTARADAGSSKASSGSLLHSSQVPFPLRSPGPCPPLRSHDCWWIFIFFRLWPQTFVQAHHHHHSAHPDDDGCPRSWAPRGPGACQRSVRSVRGSAAAMRFCGVGVAGAAAAADRLARTAAPQRAPSCTSAAAEGRAAAETDEGTADVVALAETKTLLVAKYEGYLAGYTARGRQ